MTHNIQYVNFKTKAKLKGSRFQLVLGTKRESGEPVILLRYIEQDSGTFITSQIYTRAEFDALVDAQHVFLNGKKFTRDLYNDTFGAINDL